uniref:Uncharacterized protein n=1 Tax=Dunaliella tertiolecta TaxID=3047 RepID=A0A7S3VTP4_DUNTE
MSTVGVRCHGPLAAQVRGFFSAFKHKHTTACNIPENVMCLLHQDPKYFTHVLEQSLFTAAYTHYAFFPQFFLQETLGLASPGPGARVCISKAHPSRTSMLFLLASD